MWTIVRHIPHRNQKIPLCQTYVLIVNIRNGCFLLLIQLSQAIWEVKKVVLWTSRDNSEIVCWHHEEGLHILLDISACSSYFEKIISYLESSCLITYYFIVCYTSPAKKMNCPPTIHLRADNYRKVVVNSWSFCLRRDQWIRSDSECRQMDQTWCS